MRILHIKAFLFSNKRWDDFCGLNVRYLHYMKNGDFKRYNISATDSRYKEEIKEIVKVKAENFERTKKKIFISYDLTSKYFEEYKPK